MLLKQFHHQELFQQNQLTHQHKPNLKRMMSDKL